MIRSAWSTPRLLGTVLLGLCAAPAPARAQAAPASAPAATPTSWVIPGAAAPSVYGLLPPSRAPLPPTPFLADGVDIRRSDARACFKSAAGRQCLTLLHPSAARPGDELTRHFAVRAPAGTDPGLVVAALASIRRSERESPWLAVAAPQGAAPAPRATRRAPVVVIGVVLLLVAIWLGARRRGAPSP
jgi:hypothetical protein